MTRPNRFLLLVSAAMIAGCLLKKEDSHPMVEMEVLPYMVPCSIVIFPGTCQIAKENGGTPGQLPGKIEGMDFQWGYRHFLEAEKVPYPPDWQDVPTHKFVAHGPTTRTVDTAWEFQAVLRDTQDFTLTADTLCFLGYPKAVLIPDPADRSLIDSAGRERPVRITVRPRGSSLLVGSGASLQ